MSLTRTVLRNTLWSGLDLIVDALLPPITSILVARAFGPSKLGAYAYIMWISTVAAVFGNLGIPMAARKYMADYAGQRRPDVVLAILRVGVIVQAVFAAVTVAAGLYWVSVSLPTKDRTFATLAVLSIFPGALMGMATAINNTMERVGINVIPSVLGGLVNAAGILATLAMDWGLVGLSASLLAGRLADGGLRWVLTARRLPSYMLAIGTTADSARERPLLPPGLGREMTAFCAQATILLLLTLIVWNRSEMFFLKRYCGLREVAYYSVAFAFALVPAQLAAPFAKAADTSLFAERGRSVERGQHVATLYWRYTGLIVLPACFGLAVLSGPLVRVLYGARYEDAALVLAVAAALGIFAPLGGPVVSLATAAGEQGLLVRCGLGAAVATIALDVLLVRSYCAMGGALANGLGQALSTGILLTVARKRLGFHVPVGFVLRLGFSAVGMAAVVAAGVHWLPDVVAIFVGPLVGVAAYAVLLKFARVVEPDDVQRLGAVGNMLPRGVRPLFLRLLHLVAKQ